MKQSSSLLTMSSAITNTKRNKWRTLSPMSKNKTRLTLNLIPARANFFLSIENSLTSWRTLRPKLKLEGLIWKNTSLTTKSTQIPAT